MTKEPFLDLGASNIPHPRATHAVDSFSRKLMFNKKDMYSNKNDYKEGDTTKERFEQRLKQMDYKFNFNYNTHKLPWPNNSFKIVYSRASLGVYGKFSAFKEAYRVLKSGGKLTFDMSGTKKMIENKINLLHEIGFVKIKTTKSSQPYEHQNKIYYSVMISATKP